MVEVRVGSHKVGVTSYRRTSRSVHVNRPMGAVDIESYKMGPTIDSHPFNIMSIGHPIPEIWLFQNLTLKIQGRGHGWGALESHKVGVTSYQLTSLSFHVNWPFHSWQHFQNLTLKIQGQGQMTMMSHNYRSRQFHRTWYQWYKSLQWFQSYGFRKVWPKCCLIWQVFGPGAGPYGANGQITMTMHNYRCRQVHETLNGVNPSSNFRDMHSAKSGPNLWQIWQVFVLWASPYGVNGQMTMTVHNYRPRQFQAVKQLQRYGFRKFGSRPSTRPDRDNIPPAQRVEG